MKMQSKEAVDEPLAVNFLLSLLHMEPMCRSIWTTWILLSVRKAQGFFFFAFRTLSGAGHSCLVSPFQTRRKTRLNNVRLFLLSKKRWLNGVELALSFKILLPHLPTLRSSNFNGFHLYNCYVNSITERWHCDDCDGTLYDRSLCNVLVARRTTCANIPRTNACDWVDIYEAGAGSLQSNMLRRKSRIVM